jgi:ribosomal protein L7/L12
MHIEIDREELLGIIRALAPAPPIQPVASAPYTPIIAVENFLAKLADQDKIGAIKAIREMTGMGLVECKDLYMRYFGT